MKGFELLKTRKEPSILGEWTVREWRHLETGGTVREYQRPDYHYWTPLDHKGRELGTCNLKYALALLRRQHTPR